MECHRSNQAVGCNDMHVFNVHAIAHHEALSLRYVLGAGEHCGERVLTSSGHRTRACDQRASAVGQTLLR